MAQKGKPETGEKTCIKGTGLCAFASGSHVAAVDVKDDKIIRIRPLHYDWKYKPEEFRPWKLEARGKVFEPPMKRLIAPFGIGYKKRVYSPNRILYPLKRVDWNLDGQRHPENRGKSGYVRISWDEAAQIVASELKRVIGKYGPESVLLQAEGHGETKVVHASHGCPTRLLDLLGGYTQQVRNPDSWEGWYWGAKHVWGCEPVGQASVFQTNVFPDVAQNTDMILFWGCDPETTNWGMGEGQIVSRFCYWFTELGIKSIYICPELNYGAAVHADKWIPVLPNTDAALQLAIAYIWLTEGTYDKEYLDTHAIGHEKFFDYVLGKEDGLPKTPKWAAEKTGVPSRIIKALARYWASVRTSVAHNFGGPYIRGAYSHEPARLEVCLLAMQELGKPGAHQFCMMGGTSLAARAIKRDIPDTIPGGVVRPNLMSAYRGYNNFSPMVPKQIIPKTMIHDAILDGSFTITGSSDQMSPVEDQFKKYIYPAEGCSEIHMIWSDTPCLMTCWNDSNSVPKTYRSPKIESIVVQHPWMENDCLFADIILPVNTKFEENDIGMDITSKHFDTLYLEERCIEPIGESKSDYEIVCLIAEKMGLLKELTEGKSVDDWIKYGFDTSGVPEAGLISWKDFSEKKYYVVPTDPNWKTHPVGTKGFHDDPAKNPLTTPTGKLEFYSKRLAEHFPDDMERPPIPKWIEGGPGWSHDERISSEKAKQYPLLAMSNHGRWRMHAQLDDINWFKEIETCKVRGPDGYLYEPVWIHPTEAAKRGIANGDVVEIFNERGGVLAGAYVTERMMPGVVYVDHGSRYDPIVPGELDRGGAINTITPHNVTSKNCAGMVVSGFLVEVKQVNLDDLRGKYPEAFNRPYDRASGLRMERVLYGD